MFFNAIVTSESPAKPGQLHAAHTVISSCPDASLGHGAHNLLFPQVMKTYHMYHAESISAESKLKEAEKQEEKQFNKSGDISVNLLRHEDRPQRRSSVKKIEKMKEKVGGREGQGSQSEIVGRKVCFWPHPFPCSRSCVPGRA